MDAWMHVDIDALAPAQRGVFARRIPRWVGVRLDSDNFACQAASISLARADESVHTTKVDVLRVRTAHRARLDGSGASARFLFK